MNIKVLIAGLLISAAGTTQVSAALIADGIATVHGGGPTGNGATANITDGGDLFLIVLNQTSGETYALNLNTDFAAFKNSLSASAQSFPLDSVGHSFLTAAGGTYQWAVFAGNRLRGWEQKRGQPPTNYGNVADWGLLTTGGVDGAAGGFAATLVNITSAVETQLAQNVIANVNTGLALSGTDSATFLPGDLADFSRQGNTLAASQVFNGTGTNAILGETSTFWFVNYDNLHTAGEGGGAKVTQLGSFTLTTSSLEFTPAGGGGGTADPVLGTITAFAEQTVNTTSAAKTVTLTNTGTAAYAIASIGTGAGSEFAATHTCGTSLAASASCNIQVTFTPTAAGARSGTLTVTPASGSPLTLALSGTGKAATVDVALGTASAFADQAVGTTSAAKTITLTNNGASAYAIASVGTGSGTDFTATSHCGTSLAAGANCTIDITFSPTQTGKRDGTLTVTPTSGTPLPQALTGNGIPATAPDPKLGTIDAFGDQEVGTTSTAKTVPLTNDGTAAYAITSIGTGSGSEFAATSHCGTSLAAGANCTIDITFSPTQTGKRDGTLTVTPATGTPLTLALTGNGTPELTGVALGTIDAFGSQSVGISSAAKTVKLTNNDSTAYAIQSIAATGDFAVTNDCNGSLAGDSSCNIQVTFTPVLAGARTGKLTVTPVSGTPLTLDLTGTGVVPANLSVSPTQLHFGSVASGKKAQLTVTLTNTGSADLTVGSVSGPDAPFTKQHDKCSSKLLKPGKSCTVGYKFAPASEDTFGATSTISVDGVDPVVVNLSGTTGAPGQLAGDPAPAQDIGFGGQFSLTGQEFTSKAGKVLVKGKPAKIVVWTDTLIIAKAPKLAAGTYEVEVVRKGAKPTGTGQASVTVHAPQLTSLSPTSGARGSELTLAGQYFGGKKLAVVFTNSTGRKVGAKLTSAGDTELKVTVPARLAIGDYQVSVANGAGSSDPSPFTVTAN
ncbi:MAG: choice-of-anchor D domain-containing protein [Methylococcaceae bacterium]|nr:choice-of-anchor D domain-containing protein [Methylococcaceae bacterium]